MWWVTTTMVSTWGSMAGQAVERRVVEIPADHAAVHPHRGGTHGLWGELFGGVEQVAELCGGGCVAGRDLGLVEPHGHSEVGVAERVVVPAHRADESHAADDPGRDVQVVEIVVAGDQEFLTAKALEEPKTRLEDPGVACEGVAGEDQDVGVQAADFFRQGVHPGTVLLELVMEVRGGDHPHFGVSAFRSSRQSSTTYGASVAVVRPVATSRRMAAGSKTIA